MDTGAIARIVGPIVTIAVAAAIGVFAYAGLWGDRGLGVLETARGEEARLKRALADASTDTARAENRVRRLKRGYLDLDLLDERARAVLGYARPDEVVIYPVAK